MTWGNPMATDRYIMGLDIGSSWTRAVIGSIGREGQLVVEAITEKASEGVKCGAINNIDQTFKTVSAVLSDAEMQAGCEIKSMILGIGGNHIKGRLSTGVIGVNSKTGEISRSDIYKSLDVAKAVELPQGSEVLHTLVQDFSVDSRSGIKDPIDMIGRRLETRVLLISGSSSAIQNHKKCVTKTGVQVQRLMLSSVADAEVTLSAEEKEMGTVLINIGAGCTNMIAYQHGSPVYAGGVPFGGDAITSDIAYWLNKSKQMAEQIKIESGSCYKPAVDPGDFIIIPGPNGQQYPMPRYELVNVIESRMAEIFMMLQMNLEECGIQDPFQGGVVLVGGGSLLSGATELCREIFQLPTKIGFPETFGGLDRAYIDPRYTTVLGLLKSEAKKVRDNFASRQNEREGGSENGNKFFRLLKKLF